MESRQNCEAASQAPTSGIVSAEYLQLSIDSLARAVTSLAFAQKVLLRLVYQVSDKIRSCRIWRSILLGFDPLGPVP